MKREKKKKVEKVQRNGAKNARRRAKLTAGRGVAQEQQGGGAHVSTYHAKRVAELVSRRDHGSTGERAKVRHDNTDALRGAAHAADVRHPAQLAVQVAAREEHDVVDAEAVVRKELPQVAAGADGRGHAADAVQQLVAVNLATVGGGAVRHGEELGLQHGLPARVGELAKGNRLAVAARLAAVKAAVAVEAVDAVVAASWRRHRARLKQPGTAVIARGQRV